VSSALPAGAGVAAMASTPISPTIPAISLDIVASRFTLLIGEVSARKTATASGLTEHAHPRPG
jgi:hypothetical protein